MTWHLPRKKAISLRSAGDAVIFSVDEIEFIAYNS